MTKQDIWLESVIEIWTIKLNDIHYEVHVETLHANDRQRKIIKTFAEVGEITDEIKTELQTIVSKIDNT